MEAGFERTFFGNSTDRNAHSSESAGIGGRELEDGDVQARSAAREGGLRREAVGPAQSVDASCEMYPGCPPPHHALPLCISRGCRPGVHIPPFLMEGMMDSGLGDLVYFVLVALSNRNQLSLSYIKDINQKAPQGDCGEGASKWLNLASMLMSRLGMVGSRVPGMRSRRLMDSWGGTCPWSHIPHL